MAGELVTAESALLPDIVIGGAPRSGTTFLCELLDKHPSVYVPRPLVPEPKICLTAHPKGDAGLRERYFLLFRDAPEVSMRLEKTANYFENDDARKRLARVLPNAKFIFILRDPVARAYSNWLWSTSNGLETLPFADAIAQEGRRNSPFPPEREHVRPFDYLKRSRYGSLAEAWVHDFGRNRLAFYTLEAALRDPEVFVKQLQGFVGIEPRSWEELRTGRINATPLAGPELQPALRASLQNQFEPEMRRFAHVTGVDIGIWGY